MNATINFSTTSVSLSDTTLPAQVSLNEPADITQFANWYKTNETFLDEHLLRSGAILFRGISIKNMADFETVVSLLVPKTADYIDGNSPRTKLSSKVYTSTEYDPKQRITMHNELSYSAHYPKRLFFCCIIPAETGGETPLADSREIYRLMSPDLVDEIKRKKITYIRNLHGGQGLGPSWQDTFETKDPAVAETYCRERDIDFSWSRNKDMRLAQIRPGVIQHPVTNEWVWFNQIDQFHPTHLGPEIYATMMALSGGKEEALPTFVTFGDGTPISSAAVGEITKTIDKAIVAKPWMAGDLLLLDNLLVCHGRMPFTGKRQVLVSMT
jgi:hypothetical protein